MPTRATTAVVRVQDMAMAKCAEELAAARLTGAVTRHGGVTDVGMPEGRHGCSTAHRDRAAKKPVGTQPW